MAEKKVSTISSINIDKLDSGCVVRVEIKVPDKNGYDGFKRVTKSYTADDELLNQVLAYVDGEVDEDIEEGATEAAKSEGTRLVNAETFIKKG